MVFPVSTTQLKAFSAIHKACMMYFEHIMRNIKDVILLYFENTKMYPQKKMFSKQHFIVEYKCNVT